MNEVSIVHTHSGNRSFKVLTSLLDGELYERYGRAQSQQDSFNRIEHNDNVIIAYAGEDAVGCGCFKAMDAENAEIKRMFVKTSHRGSGVAFALLSSLEQLASQMGFAVMKLETGIKQPEAIRFYGKNGYRQIEKYEPYTLNPNSICMEKVLNPKS